MNRQIVCTLLLLTLFMGCNDKQKEVVTEPAEQAAITLDMLYKYYAVPQSNLLRENYPFDEKYTATYLAGGDQIEKPHPYSYLWPYSGTFSAVNALFEATGDERYRQLLELKVLPGLEEYFDEKRTPAAYASYIRTASESDRFYDDNIWLGIDFTDLYVMTDSTKYLEKAKVIWRFVVSGMDDELGGGIYWCEQKKQSKNTCSNAPAAVFAFKLFEATGDSLYFTFGQQLFDWTKEYLQDRNDCLFYDNIGLNGHVDDKKYAYNSGQMMQAAALLYKLTNDEVYLNEAQHIASACYRYFFTDFTPHGGDNFMLLKKGDIWFTAVMFRGFVELYKLDKNSVYLDAFQQNLAYAWTHAREENGLFNTDWSGQQMDDKKWLLTQAAFVEMYARVSTVWP